MRNVTPRSDERKKVFLIEGRKEGEVEKSRLFTLTLSNLDIESLLHAELNEFGEMLEALSDIPVARRILEFA